MVNKKISSSEKGVTVQNEDPISGSCTTPWGETKL